MRLGLGKGPDLLRETEKESGAAVFESAEAEAGGAGVETAELTPAEGPMKSIW